MINIHVNPTKRSVYPTAIFKSYTELHEMVAWNISEEIKRDFPYWTFMAIKSETWEYTRNWRPL